MECLISLKIFKWFSKVGSIISRRSALLTSIGETIPGSHFFSDSGMAFQSTVPFLRKSPSDFPTIILPNKRDWGSCLFVVFLWQTPPFVGGCPIIRPIQGPPATPILGGWGSPPLGSATPRPDPDRVSTIWLPAEATDPHGPSPLYCLGRPALSPVPWRPRWEVWHGAWLDRWLTTAPVFKIEWNLARLNPENAQKFKQSAFLNIFLECAFSRLTGLKNPACSWMHILFEKNGNSLFFSLPPKRVLCSASQLPPPVLWSPVPNLPKSAGPNLPCAFGLGEDNRRGR